MRWPFSPASGAPCELSTDTMVFEPSLFSDTWYLSAAPLVSLLLPKSFAKKPAVASCPAVFGST